ALAGPQERARFRIEAEASARMRHPNIVQVYEVGEHQGRPYFAMELVEGGSLDQHLAGRSLPAPEAAQLVHTMALAVEHARPHEVGPAADVYALGAILYELLAGRPPFQADSWNAMVQQVLHDEPAPPTRLRPDVPRELETICLKCLEKEPERRYASAAALADDLRRFQAHEPVQARPVGTAGRLLRWYRRKPALATLAASLFFVFLSGVAGVGWQWLRAER